jgi:hypothetical protein
MPQRSQLIFISSKQRISGSAYDYMINFNDGVLKADKGHFMRLTLVEATINRSWYSIQEGSNTFNVVDNFGNITTIAFPIAYYNAVDIRSTLAGLLPSGWIITYDRKTNKFTFNRGNDSTPSYKFVFSNSLHEILGFRQGEEPTFTIANPSVVSTLPIRVNEENAVVINTNLPRRNFSSVDNHNTINKNFKESSILAKLPILAPPFDNIVYQISTPTFMYDITADSISSVRVWLTDENERPLQVPYDWSMTWSVEFLPLTDNNHMKDIKELIQLMVLSNDKLIST